MIRAARRSDDSLYAPAEFSAEITNPADAGSALADKFRDLRSDPNGSDPPSDGGEMGMYSLHRMVTDRLTAPENTGFVRSDAALAVIFLSDERHLRLPPLTSPIQTMPPDYRKYDPDGAEAAEYARACSAIRPDGSNVLAELVALKGDAPVFVGGILRAPLRPRPLPLHLRALPQRRQRPAQVEDLLLRGGRAVTARGSAPRRPGRTWLPPGSARREDEAPAGRTSRSVSQHGHSLSRCGSMLRGVRDPQARRRAVRGSCYWWARPGSRPRRPRAPHRHP